MYTDFCGNELIAKTGDVIYLPKGKKYEVQFLAEDQFVKCILINFVLRDSDGAEMVLYDDITHLCNDNKGEILKSFQKISLLYKTQIDRLSIKIEFLKLIKNIVNLTQESRDLRSRYAANT